MMRTLPFLPMSSTNCVWQSHAYSMSPPLSHGGERNCYHLELENLNQASFSCTAEFSFYAGLTCHKGTFSIWWPRWKLNAVVSILFVLHLLTVHRVLESLCAIKKKKKDLLEVHHIFVQQLYSQGIFPNVQDSTRHTTEDSRFSWCHYRTCLHGYSSISCPDLHAKCNSSSWQNLELRWNSSE